jgi:hemerythrin-like metal-binding protein
MDKFLWKESLGTGIDEIDSQNRTLLKCLNECTKKTAFPADVKDFVSLYVLLNELTTHADAHFKSEEELMRSVNYPELELHQQQHRLFVEQVEQLRRAVNSGEKPVIAYLAAFLGDWYIRHILVHDRQIGVHMLSRG